VVQASPSGDHAIFVVRFLPEGRTVTLDGPTDVFQAAAACGILLEQPCAGLARCGNCRIRVLEGAGTPSSADEEVLGAEELGQGWRPACTLTLRGSATIEVPGPTRSALPKGLGAAVVPDEARVPVVEPRVGAGRLLGLALDIGTTSLAAALGTVFVAGTFGQYVRKASMLRLGLLPAVAPERILTVGNAAGAGAVLALLDRRVRGRAERLANDATYVELAGRLDYQEARTRGLRFPAAEEVA
jgi:uncharacterized 2Fe-2S/4Fe-4S cluster protein (DUF4445 family)